MFEQLIDNYVNRLDNNTLSKFAYDNGIILEENECNKAIIFIRKYYKLIIFNKNEQLLESLMQAEFDKQSYEKLKNLMLIARKKFKI